MAEFHLIRRNLGAALEAAEDVRQVHSSVPDSVGIVPAAIVTPGEPAAIYHRTSSGGYAGLVQFNFDVVLLAYRFGNQHGQTELDRFIGTDPGSVIDALESDQTLGDTAKVVKVTEAGDYGQIRVADTDYVGCRFIVEVHA